MAAIKLLDQAYSITYMKEGYADTENDLKTIINLINNTSLSKPEIKTNLKNHRLNEFMEFDKNSVSLERCVLHFKNDSLERIELDW